MSLYSLDGVSPQLPADGNFWIAPDANVIGNVVISSGASVWFGTTIRGDNEQISIGENVNVQENCVLHTDPGFPIELQADVTVGHKAMLHGCSVGEGSLIGMGATILNGATIGKESLIGAGALVTEGKSIPAGVLAVGAPARVLRDLTEDEKDGLRKTAKHYVENQVRFRKGLAAL